MPISDEMDPLTRLAIKHGTDKWGAHFYTPVYHALFGHLRDKPIRLLEIGIGGYGLATVGGASLAMWADYFPAAQIVGIDIYAKKLDLDPRIHVRQGRQDDPVFLTQLSVEFGPFDIVIDDGSHIPKDVVSSFDILFPKLADPGLYVIEDVQTTFWPSCGGSALHGGPTMYLAKCILEHLNHVEIKLVQPNRAVSAYAHSLRSFRAYHNLFVVEKGNNTEPSKFDYSFDNAHAAHALRAIEDELTRSPTPEGYVNLIELCRDAAHDLSKASAVLEYAMARWPDHPGLLLSAYNTAKQRGDRDGTLEYLSRLSALENDNPVIQEWRAEAEALPAIMNVQNGKSK